MKVAIMQPYFLPYIGYWQLMNAVDQYVIYDDVNFIKQGWVNRNRILLNGQPHFINVPMIGASSCKKINEIGVNADPRLAEKNLRMIQAAYAKAPRYKHVYPLIQDILHCPETNLANFIIHSIRAIAKYLGIQTKLLISSQLEKDETLHAQDKVIDICRRLGATVYCNAIGGQSLYSFEAFRQNGMALFFLQTDEIRYQQYTHPFQANLSIIDMMMFCSRDEIQGFLGHYKLLGGGG